MAQQQDTHFTVRAQEKTSNLSIYMARQQDKEEAREIHRRSSRSTKGKHELGGGGGARSVRSMKSTWRSTEGEHEVDGGRPPSRARTTTARESSLLHADGNGDGELPPARGRRRRGRAPSCPQTATARSTSVLRADELLRGRGRRRRGRAPSWAPTATVRPSARTATDLLE